jgi:hypothetical protein
MQNQKEKPSSKDDLAMEIAKNFQEEGRVDLYRRIFQKHEIPTIRKAFEKVSKVPADKIKKSKSALFCFLLNKNAGK